MQRALRISAAFHLLSVETYHIALDHGAKVHDWIQRCHLLVREIVFNRILINFVQKLFVGLNEAGNVFDAKICQILHLDGVHCFFYLTDFELEVANVLLCALVFILSFVVEF